ncbi:hypothetical protein BDY21DRAFT_423556 [Lineolata rhizophorae]|uniref:Uncharacterized protein n=1 Tax=Lineolata rhizophorae TaxID=578093 RepID=A0A6A6NSC3_9PEZI|nr:hypothetical protein BDY21DRAFT_423556 [Lineolata rhizophorae]
MGQAGSSPGPRGLGRSPRALRPYLLARGTAGVRAPCEDEVAPPACSSDAVLAPTKAGPFASKSPAAARPSPTSEAPRPQPRSKAQGLRSKVQGPAGVAACGHQLPNGVAGASHAGLSGRCVSGANLRRPRPSPNAILAAARGEPLPPPPRAAPDDQQLEAIGCSCAPLHGGGAVPPAQGDVSQQAWPRLIPGSPSVASAAGRPLQRPRTAWTQKKVGSLGDRPRPHSHRARLGQLRRPRKAAMLHRNERLRVAGTSAHDVRRTADATYALATSRSILCHFCISAPIAAILSDPLS